MLLEDKFRAGHHDKHTPKSGISNGELLRFWT